MNDHTDSRPAKSEREHSLPPSPGSVVERPKLPALSIRQPWAWMIVNAGKDIENRNWTTRFRGRFLIHAAKGCTKDEYQGAIQFARRAVRLSGYNLQRYMVPEPRDLHRGGIIAEAEIVDCVQMSTSPWFVGEHGFVLRNVKALPFTPCRGALGFFYPQNAKAWQEGRQGSTENTGDNNEI